MAYKMECYQILIFCMLQQEFASNVISGTGKMILYHSTVVLNQWATAHKPGGGGGNGRLCTLKIGLHANKVEKYWST